MQAWLDDFRDVVQWQLQANLPVVWFYVPNQPSAALNTWLGNAALKTHDRQLLDHAAPPNTQPPQGWKWYALDVRHASPGWLDALIELPDVVTELSSVITSNAPPPLA